MTDRQHQASDYDIAAEYAGKADHYARLWAPVLVELTRPLLATLPLAAAQRVLDVGTGSGGHLPTLRHAAPSATLYGVDLSLGMLQEIPRASAAALAVMEINRLAIREQTMDVALSTFILQHVADPEGAFGEMSRSLRPGGWIGLASWGSEHSMPAGELWVETLDRHEAGADPRPDESFRDLVDTPGKVEALLQGAGFDSIRSWSERGRWRWSRDDLMEVHQLVCAPSRRLKTLPDDRRRACVADARRQVEAMSDDELRHEPEVVLSIARRPA